VTPVEVGLVLSIFAVPVGAVWVASRLPARERAATDSLSPWAIVVALVLPIAGLIIAIVLFAQGRGAHGAAALLASVLGWFIAAAIFL
jgi:uncharacterized BrkB/YihY/UPF0761 family membrane protein